MHLRSTILAASVLLFGRGVAPPPPPPKKKDEYCPEDQDEGFLWPSVAAGATIYAPCTEIDPAYACGFLERECDGKGKWKKVKNNCHPEVPLPTPLPTASPFPLPTPLPTVEPTKLPTWGPGIPGWCPEQVYKGWKWANTRPGTRDMAPCEMFDDNRVISWKDGDACILPSAGSTFRGMAYRACGQDGTWWTELDDTECTAVGRRLMRRLVAGSNPILGSEGGRPI